MIILLKILDFAKENLQKGSASLSPEIPSQGAAHAMLMRVYLQRAGYSLQQDGSLNRPADDKRKAYFDAVIAEWTAFQNKGYHTSPGRLFEVVPGLFRRSFEFDGKSVGDSF